METETMTDTTTTIVPDEAMVDELGVLELETLTSFTLADAIREGSKHVKHVRRSWGNGETTGCALTTALVGAKKVGWIE